MANAERNWGERTGRNVRNVGIVIGVLGLIAMAETAIVLGAGLGASGVIFEKSSKGAKKK